jgi:predicted DNA-binding transcriptional regulator YafY
MSRSNRLFSLVEALRRYRYPVTAAALAEELGVSVRTIYRDIQTLVGQGATIEGEAGLGYLLKPGFLLPPLMFAENELEALGLGMRWVAQQEDSELARAARHVLAKVMAVLPPDLASQVEGAGLLVPPTRSTVPETILPPGDLLADLRQALRTEQKLRIHYCDRDAQASERIIWPIALAFFRDTRVLAAWCETRQDYRHFRLDRIHGLEILPDRAPIRRRTLMIRWRRSLNIPDPDQPARS